ncbi:carboxypeptidase-like regulatory domain-containing protein [Phocaeicola sp.]
MIFFNFPKHSIKACSLILLLLIPFSVLHAQSPDMPVSLHLKEATLKTFAANIEKVSGYSFIYGEEVVLKRPITLSIKKASLQTVLKRAFAGQDISFEFTSRHILLRKEKPQPVKRRYTLNGYVLDSISKETLIGANVYEKQNAMGTTTNPFGYFSITLPEGNTKLNFSYIGYASQQVDLHLCKDTLITVCLPYDNQLEEIVILSDKPETGVHSSRMGATTVPLDHIKNTPVLLSESDVLKSIQLLPGVQGGISGTSGLYVRGGGPDQNLYLLDGVPLYNVDHTLGFLSVFTPEAVKKVDLYKGSFPARFGGRLSSVVDVRTNDGDMRHYHGSFTIGLLTSRFHFEGPIWKDRTSFIVSARRSYFDLLMKPFLDDEAKGGYYLYDINAKVNHRFSDRDRLFLSFYNGRDFLSFDNKYEDPNYTEKEKQTIHWGSTLGNIRWNHVWNSSLFNNTTLSYNRFRFRNNNDASYMKERYRSRYRSGIDDAGITSDFDFHPVPSHFIKFGGKYLYHTFRPEVQHTITHTEDKGESKDEEFTIAGHEAVRAHEMSLYAEDDFNMGTCWKANIGGHLSLFHVQKHTYTSIEPRLSLSYSANPDWIFKTAYTHMTQYVHLLSSSAISLPTDLWVPVTKNIRPMLARQFSVGGYYSGIRGWEFSVEGYYKTLKNVLEYKDGSALAGNSANWEEKVEMGTGRNFGVEFMVEKKTGRTTGWINYTLAKADRKFSAEGINGGKRFPYKYDRRHSVNVTVNHQLTQRIDLSASWTFASGNTATLPKEQGTVIVPGSNGWLGSYYQTNTATPGKGANESIFPTDYTSSRNNFRLPSSHQLNLGVNFHKKTKHGERIWNVSLVNAYNAMNPNHVYIDYKTETPGNQSVPVLKKLTLLPCLPSFSYTYKF